MQAWWRELGFDADRLADAVTLTPAVRPGRRRRPAYARAAMTHVREAAKYLLPE